MRRVASILLIFSLFNTSIFAQTNSLKSTKGQVKNDSLNIRQLALPSEVENIGKRSGSVFYSPSVKGKVLMPVHFWGQIKNSGLHFIPINTNLVSGISLAGGPNVSADYEEVFVTTTRSGKREKLQFNLDEGGELSLEDFTLKPGDTVFIAKDNFTQDRAYYTSLVGVIATVLSSILIYQQIK